MAHLAVKVFRDETEFIDSGVGSQTANQADKFDLQGFNRTNAVAIKCTSRTSKPAQLAAQAAQISAETVRLWRSSFNGLVSSMNWVLAGAKELFARKPPADECSPG